MTKEIFGNLKYIFPTSRYMDGISSVVKSIVLPDCVIRNNCVFYYSRYVYRIMSLLLFNARDGI